jgi:hypothetical protein
LWKSKLAIINMDFGVWINLYLMGGLHKRQETERTFRARFFVDEAYLNISFATLT